MTIEFEASKPIYIQIAEKVYKQIIRGEISPGDKLPSVREMAIQAGVNPNTIQRTYSEMERTGIVETKRGQGTFVVERQEIVMELRQSLQHEILSQFVHSMNELGYSKEEMLVNLQAFLKGDEQK